MEPNPDRTVYGQVLSKKNPGPRVIQDRGKKNKRGTSGDLELSIAGAAPLTGERRGVGSSAHRLDSQQSGRDVPVFLGHAPHSGRPLKEFNGGVGELRQTRLISYLGRAVRSSD